MSLHRAMRDLTDPERVKDAEHALRRAELAGGGAALADWAREWAMPALDAIREGPDPLDVDDLEDELADARADREEKAATLAAIEEMADAAIIEIGAVDLDLDDARAAIGSLRRHFEAIAKRAAEK